MASRPNPVSIEEAMDVLYTIYSGVLVILQDRLGQDTKAQLHSLRRALVAVLKRHDKKRLKNLSPR
jgi:hypothetical protein